jgi:protein SCO1
VIAAALLLAATTATTATAATAATPANLHVDVKEHLGGRLPLELGFRDSDGRPVRLARFFPGDKPVVVVLAYFNCPMLCGLVLRQTATAMSHLDWRLGREYRALTVSFDPRDLPAEARRAQETTAAAAGVAPDAWPFLVGDEAQIHLLADALGFEYQWDPRSQQFAHPAVVFVLSPDGRIARYLYGLGAEDPHQLKLALLEAAQGKVGSIVDRVLLTCFHWDPATRRYGLFVVGFLRAGAAVMLLLVGGLIAFLLGLERRKRRLA